MLMGVGDGAILRELMIAPRRWCIHATERVYPVAFVRVVVSLSIYM